VIVDRDDVQYGYGNPADMVEKTQRQIAEIPKHRNEVLCLGGDHFISLPVIRAHVDVHGPLSLVHFDAHTDTDSHGNAYDHGSMFYHAVEEGIVDPERSVQVGIRTEYDKNTDRFVVLSAPWIQDHGNY